MKQVLWFLGSAFALAIVGQILTVNAAPYPAALGGTGTSQIPASGTIPIGNGAGSYTPAFLTPGSNVTITNGSGTVTISATAGSASGTVFLITAGHGISLSPASITASGTIAVNTSTIIQDVVASGQLLPSSTTYVASVNGQSGAVTFGIPATTTVNGTQATIFKLIGDGTTVTSTVNGSTTIFSIITTGNWSGTWQNATSGTYYQSSNPSGFISGNQTITFKATGDATGTATGATSITDSLTITGLQGKALPSLATGTLTYTGGAWTFNNNTYLLSGVNVTTTAPLSGGGALTTAGLTLTCATCLTANQTITLTGAVTGSGATSIATTYTTSTLYGFFSATGPIVYNSSTGAFSWTNSNNYISTISINGNSGTSFQVLAGSGVTSTVAGTNTTLSLNLSGGCNGSQFVSNITPSGVISCATPSGGASSTNVYGIEPILVAQTGVNATTSYDTTYPMSLSALYTFLKGATIDGTTTLASTTNAILLTNGSGTVAAYAGTTCPGGESPNAFSATGTFTGCLTFLTGNQSITLTGAVTGNGATTIATAFTTSTLYALFSASGPGLSYSSATGQFTYSSSSLNLGSAAYHPASDFLASSTNLAPSTTIPTAYVSTFNGATGTVTGVSSLANNAAAGGINFSAATGSAITAVLNSLALSQFTGNIVNTFNGATGTITYAPSTTIPTVYVTSFNGSSGVVTYAPSTTIPTVYVVNNLGNWAGTWQGVNSSTFYLASNPSSYITTTTYQSLNGWSGLSWNVLGSGNVTSSVTNGSTTFSLTGVIPASNGGTATTTALGSNAFTSTAIPTVFVSSFNTRTGAVTLSNGDVLTALGYTPINASTSATSTWLLTSNGTNWIASAPPQGVTSSTIWGLFSNSATGLTYTNTTGATALTSGYFIPLTASGTQWNAAYASSSLITSALGTNAFNSTAFITTSTYNGNFGTAASHPATDFIASSTNMVNTLNGATGTVTISSSSLGVIYNPSWITTSTYNASMTIATAGPLGGGGSLTNGSTISLTCATCIAANTGNWAGTWQGVNSSTFYLATNPSSYVTASVVNGYATSSAGGAGSYTNANITVNANGIVTAAANGSGGSGSGVASTTPYTAGYIPVASTSLALTNSPIFEQASTTNLGIGTSTPAHTLVVTNASGTSQMSIDTSTSTPNYYLQIQNSSTANVFSVASTSQAILNGQLSEPVYDNGTSTAGSATINWNNSNKQQIALATTTTALSFSNVQSGGSYTLWVEQDTTGSRTVTWPSSGPGEVQWASSTVPTLTTTANNMDVFSFQCFAPHTTTTITCFGQYGNGNFVQ